MAIDRIKNRDDFSQYCLRQLGEPVIRINVSPDQVEDCIDDALDMFWEYHADGSTQMFFKHQMTQTDIDNRYITVPDGVLSVIRVLSLNGGSTGATGIANMNNLQVYSYFSDLIAGIPSAGISSYIMNMSYLNTINDVFNGEKLFEYNKHQNRLYIQGSFDNISLGDYIVYECVTINDPSEFPKTWNNWWLKNYTTALIKKRWGNVIGKYQNVTLPSGITLNGEAIRSEAVAEIEQLEDRLRKEFSLPPDFFVG